MIDASKLVAAAREQAQSDAGASDSRSYRPAEISTPPVYPSKSLAVKDGHYVVVERAKGDVD